MGKVFEFVCKEHNEHYLTFGDSAFCDICNNTCDIESEFEEADINEEVLKMLTEGGETETKPKIRVVYKDGKKVVIKCKKKTNKIISPNKIKAAINAGKYAWTPAAAAKRRKSLAARKEAGLIGEGFKSEGSKIDMKYGKEFTEYVKKELIACYEGKNMMAPAEDVLEGMATKMVGDMIKSFEGVVAEDEMTVGGLMVKEAFTLETEDGAIELKEGYFMAVTGMDDNEDFLVDIFDEADKVVAEDAVISEEDLEGVMESADVVEDMEISESVAESAETEPVFEVFFSVKGGKLHKYFLKAKKGFKRVGNKYVKLSAAAIAKMKRSALKAGRKAHTGLAKRSLFRSLKIRKAKGLTEGTITEEVQVGEVLNVTTEFSLDTEDGNTVNVPTDSVVVISDADENGDYEVDIYDADSNPIIENIILTSDDIDAMVNGGYVEQVPEEELDAEEGVIEVDGQQVNEVFLSVKHGKLKKFALKAKAGFKRVGTKYVKIAAATMAKMKRNAIKAGKKARTGVAKLNLKKSLKIRKNKGLNEGVDFNLPYSVQSAFDVEVKNEAEEKVISLSEGDVITFNDMANGLLQMSVKRNNETVEEKVSVDYEFVHTCISEGLVVPVNEDVSKEFVEVVKEGKEVETLTNETKPEDKVAGTELKYDTAKGYVVVKEGKEVVLGNRVRARSYLLNESYKVDAKVLDDAFAGKKVELV